MITKSVAVMRALVASAVTVDDGGRIVGPGSFPETIYAEAEKLFDFAVKYKYGPEILYRQQCEWRGEPPIAWEEVKLDHRIGMTLFQAAVHALAPFIAPPAREAAAPAPASPGRGFDRIADGDDGPQSQGIGAREEWVKPPAEPVEPKPQAVCELCGEPMPRGEEMFKFHGYSGPCPRDLQPVDPASIAPAAEGATGGQAEQPVDQAPSSPVAEGATGGQAEQPVDQAPSSPVAEGATGGQVERPVDPTPIAPAAEDVPHPIDPEGEHDVKPGKGKRRK